MKVGKEGYVGIPATIRHVASFPTARPPGMALFGLSRVKGRSVVECYLVTLCHSLDASHDPNSIGVAKNETVRLSATVIGISRLIAVRRSVDIFVLAKLEYAVGTLCDPGFSYFIRNTLSRVLDDLYAPRDFLDGEQSLAMNI